MSGELPESLTVTFTPSERRGPRYENSNGLVEIAVNQGHAAQQLGLKPGDRLTLM